MHASSWKLFLECLRVVHLLVWCKTRFDTHPISLRAPQLISQDLEANGQVNLQ
ncbi:hypothetical protein I3843_05G113800 [Carya illinoinensis]|nr:hypothetical protein I3843_05G113800 [Carya illinoinensis]